MATEILPNGKESSNSSAIDPEDDDKKTCLSGNPEGVSKNIGQNGKQEEQEALDSKSILFYTHLVVGVCQGCFFIYQSLLPYLFKKYGVDTVTFGYVMSGAALLQLLLSPIIGKFGDKFGARAVLLLSATSTACGHLSLGFAQNFVTLLGARLVTVTQDVRSGAQMMVSDLVPGKDRGVAMGKIMLPMSLGMFIGPALGGQLAKYLGDQNSMLITWLAPVACVIILLTFVPSKTRQTSSQNAGKKGTEKKNMMALLKQGRIPILIMVKILAGIPFMTFAQNIGVIGMTVFKLTPQMNGLILSYNGVLGMIISAFLMGKLTKLFTEDQLMKLSPILLVSGYLLLSQINSFWWMFLVLIPWNLGYSVLDNQIVSRLTRSVPQSDTGAMVGLNAALFQLARIIAPLLGGVIIQNYGFQYIGYFGGVVSILLASISYLSF